MSASSEGRVAAEASITLVPASRFTIEQLTAAYNQTRVDYLVPMPMNAARLAEYISLYDVSLDESVVALDGPEMLGLAMLGVRAGRGWVTRLGVLPAARRRHIGRALMDAAIANSDRLGLGRILLEVIKNNIPAYNLFVQCGFAPIQSYAVIRRPPGPPAEAPEGMAEWLDQPAALALLGRRADQTTWITENDSLARTDHLQAMRVRLADGSAGWAVFQEQKFRGLSMLLSRLILRTEAGDPHRVGRQLLAHLYRRFPDLDTQVENVADDDPHLGALQAMGFFESFSRIEMHRFSPSLPGARA